MAEVFLNWKDIYETGIETLDNQHRKMMELANKLYDSPDLRTADKETYIKQIIMEAISVTGKHFESEEKVMKYCNYPKINHHIKEHNYYRQNIMAEVDRIKRTGRIDPVKVSQIVKEWMLQHVAIEDHNLKIFLKNNNFTSEQVESIINEP